MEKEKVLDKIKKLLALSADNPSDEESYSALAKAQALMAQYKIEEGELKEEEKPECVSVETKFSYGSSSSDIYLSRLADILAANFCCVNYLTKQYGSKKRTICFMGLPKDVDTAVEAMTIANDAIVRGYNVVWKEMCKKYGRDYIPAKAFNPAKLGYIKGYLHGLKEVLDSQREQIQEWGLVLVAPQEATDFVNGLSKETSRIRAISNDFYDQGYADGKRFNMNKKLDGESREQIEGE